MKQTTLETYDAVSVMYNNMSITYISIVYVGCPGFDFILSQCLQKISVI